MYVVLIIITVLGYLSGGIGMLESHTVFQEIASSVSFVCGTVALTGAAIVYKLQVIIERLPELPPKPPQPLIDPALADQTRWRQ